MKAAARVGRAAVGAVPPSPLSGLPLAASQIRRRVPPTLPRFALRVTATLALLPGCVADHASRPPHERVTYRAKEESEPAFHLRGPAAASVAGPDFDALWASIYRATRDAGFRPDLEDYRLGLLTTRPLVSAQWFEPWRGDVGSWAGRFQASMATLRRTVRWQVTRTDDGSFAAAPKVLVERWSLLEHRITSAAQYGEVFALTVEEQRNQRLRALDPAAFAEDPSPAAYWYAVGRDEDLERSLTETVRGRVRP